MEEIKKALFIIPTEDGEGEFYYECTVKLTGSEIVLTPKEPFTPATMALDRFTWELGKVNGPLEGPDLEGWAREYIEGQVMELANVLWGQYNELLDLTPPVVPSEALAKFLPPSQNV